jgi:hypothetical protein
MNPTDHYWVAAAKTHLSPKNRCQAPAFAGALTKRHSILDPSLPADNSPLSSGEMRGQFTELVEG